MSVRPLMNATEESAPHSIVKSNSLVTSSAGIQSSNSNQFNMHWIDYYERFFFPLITKINREFPLPIVLDYFQYLFLFIQLFIGSFFTFFPEEDIPYGYKLFQKIVFIGLSDSIDIMKYSFFIFPFLSVLSIVLFTIIYVKHLSQNEFKSWECLIIRYLHGYLSVLIFIPSLMAFIASITYRPIDGSVMSTSSSLFNIFSLAYILFLLFFYVIPLCSPPYLFPSGFVLWRPTKFFSGIFFLASPIAIGTIFQKTEIWGQYVSLVLLLLLSPISLYFFLSFPFSGIFFNCLFTTAVIQCDVNCIFAIVVRSGVKLNRIIFFLAPTAIFFATFIIIFIIMKNRRKKCVSNLTEDKDHNESEKETVVDRFPAIRYYHAMYILQVGLEEHCDFFLNWSLSRHLLSLFPDDNDITLMNTWFVSFFPSESTFLHSLITVATRMKSTSFAQRALVYQLYRIYLFRQSSASPEAMNDFQRARKVTQICAQTISQYWSPKNISCKDEDSVFAFLVHHRKIADTMWMELLSKYPNNSSFATQYSSYLLEAKSHFMEAIIWHQKALQIENGLMVQHDRMFFKFVQTFPNYLKDRIVDPSGNLRKGENHGLLASRKASFNVIDPKSNNENNNFNKNNDANLNNLDIDMEEAVSFLPMLRLRLASEKLLFRTTLPSFLRIEIGAIFRMVMSVIWTIIVFVFMFEISSDGQAYFNTLQNFNNIAHSSLVLTNELAWFYFTGFNNNLKNIISPSSMISFLNFSAKIDLTLVNLSRIALNQIDQIFKSVYGTYESQNLGIFFSHTFTENIICQNNGIPLFNQSTLTIDYLVRSYITSILNKAQTSSSKRVNWGTNDNFCELFMQKNLLLNVFEKTSEMVSPKFSMMNNFINHVVSNGLNINDLLEMEEKAGDIPDMTFLMSADKKCEFFIAWSPFFIFLFSIPSLMFLSVGTQKDKTLMQKILRSFEPVDCEEASNKIRQDILRDDNENLVIPKKFHHSFCSMWLLNLVLSFLTLVMIMISIITTFVVNKDIEVILEHYNLIYMQRNYVFLIGCDFFYTIFLNQMETEHFVTSSGQVISSIAFSNSSETKKLFYRNLLKSYFNTNLLNNGFFNITGSSGYDTKVDYFRSHDFCVPPIHSKDNIEFFACLSFDRILHTFIDRCQKHLLTIESVRIGDKSVIQLYSVLMSQIANGYIDMFELYVGRFKYDMNMIVVVDILSLLFSLFFIFIAYLSEYLQIRKLSDDFISFKSLLLRMNPISWIHNHPLATFLFGKIYDDVQIESAAQSVFAESIDPIIFLTRDFRIENMNKSTENVFSLNSEQLLGQNIKQLIHADDSQNSLLYSTLQLMISGQSKLIYEFEAIGTRDNGEKVRLRLILIGFAKNRRHADSFAICLRDMTCEMKEKELVDQTKKRWDNLMLQLVPSEILSKIQRGDSDLFFDVPKATMIFIDIDRFSQYISTLHPKDVLKNISMIFSAFDQVAGRSEHITKIKIIGDTYFAGGGLFSNDSQDLHASQVAQFALGCIDALDELNIQLDANLQVRIGIHTAGPLLAGIYGIEAPLFDVFGPSIKITKEIEQSAPAGTIRISNATYEIIANQIYNFEKADSLTVNNQTIDTYLLSKRDISSQMTQAGSQMSFSMANMSFLKDPLDLKSNGSTFADLLIKPVDI